MPRIEISIAIFRVRRAIRRVSPFGIGFSNRTGIGSGSMGKIGKGDPTRRPFSMRRGRGGRAISSAGNGTVVLAMQRSEGEKKEGYVGVAKRTPRPVEVPTGVWVVDPLCFSLSREVDREPVGPCHRTDRSTNHRSRRRILPYPLDWEILPPIEAANRTPHETKGGSIRPEEKQGKWDPLSKAWGLGFGRRGHRSACARARDERCASTQERMRGIASGWRRCTCTAASTWMLGNGPSTDCTSDPSTPWFGTILSDEYRRQLYFNYEKRIRKNSQPDKVYAYFASVVCEDGSQRMTFADLARSVLPVFQPTGSPGIKSGALPGEPVQGTPWCDTSDLLQTFDLDEDGLVSYPEYVVFLALYRMQRKECEAFFRTFDTDGDGKLSQDEFERMIENIMAAEKLDKKGYGLRTGMKAKGTNRSPQTALTKYVYREEEDPAGISLEQFKLFLQSLHDDITWAEFSHYDVARNGWICGQDFAKAMIAGADITSISKYLHRVREMPPHLQETRINFEQFYSFRILQEKLGESEQVSSMFANCNIEEFRNSTRACTLEDMPDGIIDIVFHLFDANRDGILCRREFEDVFAKKPT